LGAPLTEIKGDEVPMKNCVKITFAIAIGFGLSTFLWGLSGYELGFQFGVGTKATQMLSNLIGRSLVLFLAFATAFWIRKVSLALVAVSFCLCIATDYVRNEFFRLGVNIRFGQLLDGEYKVGSISKTGYYSPWKVEIIGLNGNTKYEEVQIGSGRNSPYCILVSDRYPLDALLIRTDSHDQEWYEVEAMKRLSGRHLSLIKRPGMQFAWTFDVIFPD
jgi:hypothetical protein